MKRIVIAISSVILAAAVVFAVIRYMPKEQTVAKKSFNYYVDAVNGSDENDGTTADSAWKSLKNVNKTEFAAGTTIHLKRGCTWRGTLHPLGDGSETAPNTITAYGEGAAPTVIGTYKRKNKINCGLAAAVVLHNQNNWVIENLAVTNEDTTQEEQFGIYILSNGGNWTKNISVWNCEVYGDADTWDSPTQADFTGITVSHGGTYDGYASQIMLDSNNVHDVKGDGIIVTGSVSGGDENGNPNENSNTLIYVQRNVLRNIGKDGIVVNNCNEPMVTHNICERAHSYATESYHVAIWAFACRNAWFSYNEVFDTKTTYDGQAFDCDYQSTGTTFMYNYAHDNEGGFMLICCEPKDWDGGLAYNNGSIVAYNIAQNNHRAQIQLTGQIKDTKIFNNTLYYSDGDTVNLYLRDLAYFPDNTQFYNNIFYNLGGGEYKLSYENVSAQNTVFSHNAFYGEHPANEPQDDAKIIDDPRLLNPGGAIKGINSCGAYTLLPDSPLLGAGCPVEITREIPVPKNLDFFGFEYDPAAPNIGACGTEYQGISAK